MIERLIALRRGGGTRRFHTEPVIHEETVAQHSFGVACIITLIEPGCSVALLKAALFHDVAEQDTGDVPAPVKWQHSELKDLLERIEVMFHAKHDNAFQQHLTDAEMVALKWADSLDLMCRAMEERKLGNQSMANIFWKVSDFLSGYQHHARGQELLNGLTKLFNEVNK